MPTDFKVAQDFIQKRTGPTRALDSRPRERESTQGASNNELPRKWVLMSKVRSLVGFLI